jgi:hypothetical protein
MDYSFDRLAIASGGRLYYWNGTLTQVTDPDLGVVLDVVWVDGYFMTTDGESLVVTELSDPTQVNPLKYGSSEVDPDPVVALLKLRNEVYALNRNTIEVFDNVGGEFFHLHASKALKFKRAWSERLPAAFTLIGLHLLEVDAMKRQASMLEHQQPRTKDQHARDRRIAPAIHRIATGHWSSSKLATTESPTPLRSSARPHNCLRRSRIRGFGKNQSGLR